jgi:hypothetical protein
MGDLRFGHLAAMVWRMCSRKLQACYLVAITGARTSRV